MICKKGGRVMFRIEKSVRTILFLFIIVAVVIIIFIPIGIIYAVNNGNPYTHWLMNQHVPDHLSEQGYKDQDLIETTYMEPKYLINHDYYQGQYKVTFKDEPDVFYYYGLSKEGKHVKQFCEKDVKIHSNEVSYDITEETKHSEAGCVLWQENR